MDTKLTVVGDSEFEILARLGDYDRRTPNALSRIEKATRSLSFSGKANGIGPKGVLPR
jgi:hypothetical protein